MRGHKGHSWDGDQHEGASCEALGVSAKRSEGRAWREQTSLGQAANRHTAKLQILLAMQDLHGTLLAYGKLAGLSPPGSLWLVGAGQVALG